MPADERESRLEEIYSAALKQDAVGRAEFLHHACGVDTALRREIESRLGYEETLEGFLETPALEEAARSVAGRRDRSLVGQKLGPYAVLSLLGAGGMGEVYSARDTRLGRLVALKTLHPDVAADLDRKRRLLLEAQAASALNDPHIVALHDMGNAEGIDFLVMEYVEGQTLDKLIPAGGMEVQQALVYAVEIAAGLARAHEAGIIHRDLKPGNIMITGKGAVKVLDFGLAKLTETSQATPSGAGSLVSVAGLILGTAAYMSPEQAQGLPVDARSDIFSFGVVLYEMLTGQRPFQGGDRTSTLAAVVQREPKLLTELNPGIPGELERVVLRCLRKDPSERYQDIADVKAALERRRRSWVGLAVAVLLLLAAGLAAYQWVRRDSERQANRELPERQITSNPMEDWVSGAAISPDGKQVAYRDQTGFLIRNLDSGETRPIPLPKDLDNRSGGGLQWFPKGGSLLADFNTPQGGAIWVVPVLGGAPPRMVYSLGTDAAISPDERSIAFENGNWDTWGREIRVGGIDGRTPRVLATGNTFSLQNPTWSPDGRWIAYKRCERTKSGGISTAIEVRPAGGGPARVLASASDLALSDLYPWWGALTWSPDWRLIFDVLKDGLWQLRVDPIKCEALGKPERLAPRAGAPAVAMRQMRDAWMGTLSMPADGKRLVLVRLRRQWAGEIAELGGGGRSLKPPRRLTFDDRDSLLSWWTRDSKAVLFYSNRNGKTEIFRLGLNDTVPERLVSGSAKAWCPQPSPDGAWLLYWEQDDPPPAATGASLPPVRLMRRPTAGGSPELVWEGPDSPVALRCPLKSGAPCVLGQPEGKAMVFYLLDPIRGKGDRIGRFEYTARDPTLVGNYSAWWVSPDGSRVAVVDGLDRIEVLTRSDHAWREIRADPPGGQFTSIAWASDGNGFFVVSATPDSHDLLHVTLDGKTERLLSRGLQHWLDIPQPSPDGKYLSFRATGEDGNVWMIENF